MNALVISYSYTGNNEALANGVASLMGADRFRIEEAKRRGGWTVFLDMLMDRTPRTVRPACEAEGRDLVVFIGPVWMGMVASPLRACFERLRPTIGRYAFASVSGGADGPNPGLAAELERRLGKAPVAVADLHIAGLLPPEPRPRRKDTSAYRITAEEAGRLAEAVVAALRDATATATARA